MTSAFDLSTQMGIALDPVDWFRATWRNLDPLPRPTAAPPDLEAMQARFALAQDRVKRQNCDWRAANLQVAMSRTEAHFWLSAMYVQLASPERKVELTPDSWSGEVTVADIEGSLPQMSTNTVRYEVKLPPECIIPLVNLCAVDDVVALILRFDLAPLADGFATYVLPYLSRDERNLLRVLVREHLGTLQYSMNAAMKLSGFLLAAYLGASDELLRLVQTWPDNAYGHNAFKRYEFQARPQDIVLGLGDAEAVASHLRRLRLPLRRVSQVRSWLAHTGTSGLDVIRDSVLTERRKTIAHQMIETLGLVNGPAVAEHMLDIMTGGSAVSARMWLDSHAEVAIVGLLPLAEQRGKRAENAREYLRELVRSGQHMDTLKRYGKPSLLVRLLDSSVLPEYTVFDDRITPEWLEKGVKAARKIKGIGMPRFIDIARLPPLLVGKYTLNPGQVAGVLMAFKGSHDDAARAFIAELNRQISPAVLERFVWAVLDTWLHEGAHAREKWTLNIIAVLGTDSLVMGLAIIAFDWAKRRKTTLFRLGLECLTAAGTDTALMQLSRLAHRVVSRRYHDLVQKQIAVALKARGLTEDQFADRFVPDCGLDSSGTRLFDYGSRQFKFVMAPDLTPMLRDDRGEVRLDLPAITSRDDGALAKRARDEWKILKRQLHDAINVHSLRLERAMADERRWSLHEFQKYFMDHPLMCQLTRLLVWGTYGNELEKTFRVALDSSLTDAHEREISLAPEARIGIVHPLHLQAAQRAEWIELLHDYEVFPPFAQFGREIYSLSAQELEENRLLGFKDRSAHVLSVRQNLRKLGWQRQHSASFVRSFSEDKVVVMIQVETDSNGYETLRDALFVASESATRIINWKELSRFALSDINPVIISEVLHDLNQVFR